MYKKILDKEQLLYRNKMSKYLSEIQNKNPKDYWKIINRHYKNKSQEKTEIDMDTLYNYYKELNKSPKINEEINEMVENEIASIQSTNTTTHILNDYITQDEIKRCIRNLKNNKCCSDDGIKNEYIKSTQLIMLPIYEKLFNLIFSSGKIPPQWLEGNIIPIYKRKGEKNKPENYRPITILSCMGKLFTSIQCIF